MRAPRARSFQRDEQRGAAGIGPFQPQIVIEQLNGFRRQRQEAQFAAFAANADLRFGKQHVVPVQSQHFAGPQPLQEHQADDGQVARGAEAGPEARHLIDRQRHDGAFGLLHAQPAQRRAWSAQAHRPAPQKGLMKAGSDLAGSVGKLVAQGAIGDGDAVIDGGTGRPRLLAGLEPHIVQERRFGKVTFGDVAGVMNALPPADKVQQVVSVTAQGLVRQAADVLAVQITIDPADLPAGGLFDNANRALCVAGGRAGRSHGTSWLSGLQQRLELLRVAALDEEAVGIVALGQRDLASSYALFPETS